MALYNHLPVYFTTEQLLIEVVRQTHSVSREHRYTLCQDLKRTLIDLLVQIYRINRTVEKAPLIDKAREQVVEVGIYLHLLVELKSISAKQYAQLADMADSLGRQLAAWQKTLPKTMNVIEDL